MQTHAERLTQSLVTGFKSRHDRLSLVSASKFGSCADDEILSFTCSRLTTAHNAANRCVACFI